MHQQCHSATASAVTKLISILKYRPTQSLLVRAVATFEATEVAASVVFATVASVKTFFLRSVKFNMLP